MNRTIENAPDRNVRPHLSRSLSGTNIPVRPAKAGLLLIILALAGCSSEPLSRPDPEHDEAHHESAPAQAGIRFQTVDRLTVAPVDVSPIADSMEVAGRVMPNEDRTARVGSFVEGVVESCCSSVGSYVKKGDVLAKIHSHITHEVIAEVASARATLQSRKAELEYARQAHERAQRLLDLKAGSLQVVQQAQSALQGAENAVVSGEAGVERAEAHLDFYGLDPDALAEPDADGHAPHPLIEIRSPMSGIIVSRTVQLGDVVTPSSELYVISNLSELWVIAQVPEESLAAVQTGMEVSVETRAYPGEPFRGRVTRVSSDLDPDSMTVQVRCVVANSKGRLKTGMYATVSLQSSQKRDALVVPDDAMQTVGDDSIVFVELERGRYEPRTVQPGRSTADGIIVLSGLQAGERIVIGGAFLLKTELLRDELAGDEH